jgi:hypothetical protein
MLHKHYIRASSARKSIRLQKRLTESIFATPRSRVLEMTILKNTRPEEFEEIDLEEEILQVLLFYIFGLRSVFLGFISSFYKGSFENYSKAKGRDFISHYPFSNSRQ